MGKVPDIHTFPHLGPLTKIPRIHPFFLTKNTENTGFKGGPLIKHSFLSVLMITKHFMLQTLKTLRCESNLRVLIVLLQS